jgi:hypothetical protein
MVKLQIRTRHLLQHIGTNSSARPSCELQKLCQASIADAKFSRPFAPFGCFTHSPPMCSCSFTSTPRCSGNNPSHTSHMVFLHGPRPVSHVPLPGTLHSRPARPRGRPLWTRPGHQHSAERCPPPRCSCLTKSEWPGAPSARGHVTLALVPHDSTAHAPHDFTAPALHDFTALAPHEPTALAPSPRARALGL